MCIRDRADIESVTILKDASSTAIYGSRGSNGVIIVTLSLIHIYSTVLRNIGVPVAHAAIALRSLMRGLNKVILNRGALDSDLENNWAVVAEGSQTILGREGYPKP